jgi:hypothetical protein
MNASKSALIVSAYVVRHTRGRRPDSCWLPGSNQPEMRPSALLDFGEDGAAAEDDAARIRIVVRT